MRLQQVPGFFVLVILRVLFAWSDQYSEVDSDLGDDEPHFQGNDMHGDEIECVRLVRSAHRGAQIASESVLIG